MTSWLRTAAYAIALMLSTLSAQAELIRKPSPHTVAETIDRLERIVRERGFTVFARVDHAANARSVDLQLRPTIVLIFGNPRAGTVLMQASQEVGIALPTKFLAWQDEAGRVWLGYEAPLAFATRHGVPGNAPVLGAIATALDGLTSAAVATP